MKRPFETIGFSYLFAQIIALFCSVKLNYILLVTFISLFTVSLFFKKLRKEKTLPIVFLTFIFSIGVFILYNSIKLEPTKILTDKDAVLTGTICDIPYKSNGKFYYIIKTEKIEIDGIDDVPQNVKMRMTVSKPFNLDVYDKICGKVHIFIQDDEHGFSSKNYYASKGVQAFSYLYEYEDYSEIENTNKPIYYYCLKTKEALNSSIRSLILSKNYGIASALLIGDQHYVDAQVKSDFRDTGISHLLAISGMHTAVIAELLMLIFLSLKFPKKLCYLLSCFGIVFFMSITGFTPSIVRAGVMIIIYNLGKCLRLKADSLNSFGFAVLLIAATNPLACGDVSFLLSVSATLGIILFSNKLSSYADSMVSKLKNTNLKKVLKLIISPICVTISATVFTLPITMLYFKQISLVCILANLLVAFPSTIFIVTMLLAAISNFIWFLKFITMPLALVSNILLNYMTFVANILAKIPLSSVSTSYAFVSFWVASTIVLIVAALIMQCRFAEMKVVALLSVILLFTGILSYQVCQRDITSLVISDVGDGCSLLLKKNNHAVVLSCGGDTIRYNKFKNLLNSLNVDKLDYVVLSDFSDSGAMYAKDLINEVSPHYVILPDRDDIDDKLNRSISDDKKAVYFNEKATLAPWKGVSIDIVNTDDQSFLYLTINSVNLLVCPARVNASYIPKEYRNCHIFIEGKIPENMNLINSNYAIMSNSENVANVNIQKVASFDKIPIVTANMGDLIIEFPKNKEIRIKRNR